VEHALGHHTDNLPLSRSGPRLIPVGLILAVFAASWPALARAQAPRPKVHIVGTGGTIAGEQFEPGTLGRYDPKKGVDEILAAVPLAGRYADLSSEQFSNIPSPAITPADWLKLARRINTLFEDRPDLAGVVVTHGTSRLEETAFFLHLTVRSDRPVVIVGAQRPPTGISPDGPVNLLSAIRTAGASTARGKGVLVVMDDRVVSARDVVKIFPRSGGFDGAEMGVIGTVSPDRVEFFYQPTRKHTRDSDFDLRSVGELPRVGVSLSYAGSPGAADPIAKGVVVATTGMAPDEIAYYQRLRRQGVFVVVTFPTGMSDHFSSSEQRVQADEATDRTTPAATPLIVARHLTPTKARILLMLALTRTTDGAEIQRIFDAY
jgi:L-asparaginase